jgi:peptidoglycan-N-acetylglucosamine deacetylase
MNILSFDIEEWFHILDNDATKSEADWANFPERIYQNMDLIHELLGSQKATFFCIGWVARKYPDVIKRISAAGHEIATHSDLHQLAYEQSHRVFNEDLSRSIQHLEALTGKKVKAYRAPGFSIMEENKWVFESLINHGIEIDCSVFPAKRAHGGFENFGTAEPCWIDIDGHKLIPDKLRSNRRQTDDFFGRWIF